MKKRLTAVLLLIVVTVAGGCANPFADTAAMARIEPEAEAQQGSIVLNTVSMFGGTDANTVVYRELIREYEAENQNVTVRDHSTAADNDWKASVVADFAVGNEPDVLQFFTEAQANRLIETGKLVTLKEILEVYPDYAKDTLPAALEQVTNTDGVKRAVPTTGFMELLYCNNDLFTKYEIALPTDWESFRHAIIAFRQHGVTPVAVSLNNIPHYWIDALILYSAGLPSYCEVPDSAPGDWVRGLEMLQTLREMGAFPSGTDTIDNDFATEMFLNKDAAMMFTGTWVTGSIADKENTIALPFPGVPEQKAAAGTVAAGFSSGFYITRAAWDNPHKREAAVRFVMKQTGAEAVTRYWEASGMVSRPATKVEVSAELTPLARSILDCQEKAGDNYANPIDARMEPSAFNILIQGAVGISTGTLCAEDTLNKALAAHALKHQNERETNVQGDDN